jgi:formylglycine-generating enzyme required for sulfatase activity
MKRLAFYLLACAFSYLNISLGQSLQIENINGLVFTGYTDSEGLVYPIDTMPLFSFIWQDNLISSDDKQVIWSNHTGGFYIGEDITGVFTMDSAFRKGVKILIRITNHTVDTAVIENFVPFGQTKDKVYITGVGPWDLARTKLFRPGKEPIGVILPDNAWEMGYCSFQVNDEKSLCAIARRKEVTNGKKERYKTILYPNGQINYEFYINDFSGDWQNGLRLMFRDKYLYDLDKFEDSLYKRPDLKWIREKYLMVLQFAWNHEFYDHQNGGYKIEEFLENGKKLCGGYDVYGIWPTWPALGTDQRNQWDLYKDLPGGLSKLKEISTKAKEQNTRFFISYNPWDQSTRKEDPYKGMAKLIQAIDADGVVLDCSGSSSYQLQHAADSIKSGVIMYSEGMAVPKDMPGIISGRVHDAIYMPPPLNLNKLIRPDFAIFRVCQLSQGQIHREVALSLFNGYGIELNTFAPGRPDWIEDEMKYLGRAVRILRENSKAFTGFNWTPLVKTTSDNIWVNKFPGDNKSIYTVYSLIPEGFNSPMIEVKPDPKNHYVSLWHHEELNPELRKGNWYIPVKADAFNKEYLGTRQEGGVDCVAEFKNLLQVKFRNDSVIVESKTGDKLLIWAGNPSYEKEPVAFIKFPVKAKLFDLFGRYEGKVVIQLFTKNDLSDEKVITVQPGSARLISSVKPTPKAASVPDGMVEIKSGFIKMKMNVEDNFVPYPPYDSANSVFVKRFYMDIYPVTNNQFYEFIESTGYKPSDTTNYLKNWVEDKFPKGMKSHPVVYINYEDAQAYAAWAGKRLPTEVEWQYASQGNDGRLYPWGNEMDSTKCNIGNDKLTSVVEYPEGLSPYGVFDLVGNVWQLTNDVYDNGSYYYIIMRGGSYYNPTSSWWYVKGGPQPLNKTQMLLRVSPGFERNATVGFRCVKDAE